MLGYGSWAIDESASGQFIGGIGFNNSKRDRGEALKDILELGWMFTASASGKGYATEALQAVLAWGRTHFGSARVIAITAPENFASMRVAQKCGFNEFLRGPSLGTAAGIFRADVVNRFARRASHVRKVRSRGGAENADIDPFLERAHPARNSC